MSVNLFPGHGNTELDNYGLRSVLDGGQLFCACEIQEWAVNGVLYSWRDVHHLKWGINFSRLGNLSDMDVKDVVTESLRPVSENSWMTYEYVSDASRANIFITHDSIDGRSGILGDCQFPVNPTPNTQVRLRLDNVERFVIGTPRGGEISLPGVLTHELGHAHGIGHKPVSIQVPSIMAPMYTPAILAYTEADIAEFVRRQGPAKVKPAPAPVPSPSAPAPTGKEPPPNALGRPVFSTTQQDGKQWAGWIERVK